MRAEREARATRRDHCRGCGTRTPHPFSGWATVDGWENTIRPRAYYRICSGCTLLVLVLADVTDAEGLARQVLDEHLRGHGGAATATGVPVGPPPLDWEAGLNHLFETLWLLYTGKWNPALGGGFTGYGQTILRKRLAGWIRDETGEASERSKGRVHPKAHAPSVSVSLDGLMQRDDGDGAAMDVSQDDHGRLDAPYTARARNFADDRSTDLARALAARSRG